MDDVRDPSTVVLSHKDVEDFDYTIGGEWYSRLGLSYA
jgi:hypothetical protein